MSDTVVREYEGTTIPASGTYTFDLAHSHVGFVVRHLVVAKVRGRFTTFEGTLVVADDPTASKVEVRIDTSSVDTGDAKRDAHLRSADFFGADAHPDMTFTSTVVSHRSGDRWQIDGDLTIGRVTQPVTLDVTLDGTATDPWGASRVAFTASTQIDREAFGLTWNQALENGGVLVGKDVKIEIEIEAVRQA